MAFTPDFLDEIRGRLPLSGVVGRRVKLQKRGREAVGLCPFHNEKTPSFTVSEDKGFYHCFGCGAHGDVIGFVMRADGLSFPEAVERLAGEAGLPVPRASPEERAAARRRADLLAAMETAAAWFEEQLRGPAGAGARRYLEGRGLAPETAAAFRLGYAPDKRGLLRAALNARDIDDGRLIEAGLIKRPDDDGPPRDTFFKRIIFPITDPRGRVIAFGGRALGDSPAKYLNSPETPLFRKGRVLYNLARARQAAFDAGELIVAEGYMDVIAMSQAGFPAAVAPLGTAITAEQIGLLWRLAAEPVLCLDGDAAGRRAGARAAERAMAQLKPGRSLRFAVLPTGEDPDSLLRTQGASALRAVLDAARPLADLLWLIETEGRRFDTPERQAGLVAALDARIRQIASGAVQTAYREDMNARFDAAFGYGPWGRVPRGGVFAGPGRRRGGPWNRGGFGGRGRGAAGKSAGRHLGPGGLGARQAPQDARRQREQLLLANLLNHPELLVEHAEDLAELRFSSPELSEFYEKMADLAARDPGLDSASVKDHLSGQGFSGALGRLCSRAVYLHGRFARPEASLEDARKGVREFLADYHRHRAALEAEEAGRDLAKATTKESVARLEANTRKWSQEIEID
ncbi:MAG: DNA primase [Kiloniellaceae bacterium]